MFGMKKRDEMAELEFYKETIKEAITLARINREDIEQLQKDVEQLKCSHPKEDREYQLTERHALAIFSGISYSIYPMIESCSLCGKEINTLTEKQWKKRELKIAEDRVKELKK